MFEVLDFYCGIGAFGEGEYLFGDTGYSVRRFWSFLESPRGFFYIFLYFPPLVVLFFSGLWRCFVISFGLSPGGFFYVQST